MQLLERKYDCCPPRSIFPSVPDGATWAVGTAIQRMLGSAINVRSASQLYPGAFVELDNGTQKEVRTVVSVAGNTVTLSADLANEYYEDHRLRVIEAEVGVRYRRNNEVEPKNYSPICDWSTTAAPATSSPTSTKVGAD